MEQIQTDSKWRFKCFKDRFFLKHNQLLLNIFLKHNQELCEIFLKHNQHLFVFALNRLLYIASGNLGCFVAER